jgi:CelD/BcsL family acetyltransferase involved in cellulose biosynthesis
MRTLSATYHNDHLPNSTHRDFLISTFERLSRTGHGSLALLRVDGEIIAAQAFLDDHETLLVFYSGYDPKWNAFSPLLVLQSEVFGRAIERGLRRLDLMRSTAPWQERWQPVREYDLHRLILTSPRPGSALRQGYYLAAAELKTWWLRTKLSKAIARSRVASAVQSGVEAVTLAAGRHQHMLVVLHHVHAHH